MQSIHPASLDVELRTRLRKMSDEELREVGRAARYMVPDSKHGQTTAANSCAAIGRSSRGVAQEASGVVRPELKC
jgi:hypothetical protein